MNGVITFLRVTTTVYNDCGIYELFCSHTLLRRPLLALALCKIDAKLVSERKSKGSNLFTENCCHHLPQHTCPITKKHESDRI